MTALRRSSSFSSAPSTWLRNGPLVFDSLTSEANLCWICLINSFIGLAFENDVFVFLTTLDLSVSCRISWLKGERPGTRTLAAYRQKKGKFIWNLNITCLKGLKLIFQTSIVVFKMFHFSRFFFTGMWTIADTRVVELEDFLLLEVLNFPPQADVDPYWFHICFVCIWWLFTDSIPSNEHHHLELFFQPTDKNSNI